MVKRKNTVTPNNDTKVAAIVIGLFAAVIILFFIFSKAKETPETPQEAPQEMAAMQQADQSAATSFRLRHPLQAPPEAPARREAQLADLKARRSADRT